MINRCIKNIAVLAVMVVFFSCSKKAPANRQAQKPTSALVKEAEKLEGFNADFYTKSFNYYWTKGRDTLDLKFNIAEHKSDSTVHIAVMNKKPLNLTVVLDSLSNIIPKIKEDFNLNKISDLYLEEPIYYPDLNSAWSVEYERQFDKKNIGQSKLGGFLLSTAVTPLLNNFLNPLHAKVEDYGIEKFHLLSREHYHYYLPDTAVTDYPDFSLHGAGISIRIAKLPVKKQH
ncbi:hypothetical protein ACV0BM_003730 [Elizabethkingia meningoseptica]